MFFTFLWRLKAVIDDIILIRMKGLYTDINISYLVYSNLSSLVCNIIKEIILKNPAVAFVARSGWVASYKRGKRHRLVSCNVIVIKVIKLHNKS